MASFSAPSVLIVSALSLRCGSAGAGRGVMLADVGVCGGPNVPVALTPVCGVYWLLVGRSCPLELGTLGALWAFEDPGRSYSPMPKECAKGRFGLAGGPSEFRSAKDGF